ncbi:RhuM family protein [Streptomyces scabiei]|uniref:RhuM family protein n=1 Tax=Streptomyces scabiei TaxID=1930 RepID=UPI0029A4875F|nr:RhuM family protein [Streptomyces scabiei]MDX3196405.1 RhuM family protein [Streptomyces scabiei]MDX3217766.1 RhuM family protein [Streptomyces scabiei]
MDAYGREYWIAREVQPLMGYPRWQHFEPVIDRARKAASNVSDAAAVFTEVRENPSDLGGRPAKDYRLTRAAAYYVAMNGDPDKVEVAAAQAYFVRRTREAELGAITLAEVRQTALARAREMVDYRLFRDMMAENAPDYEPSSKATQLFFAATQNKLYLQVVGMTAQEIKEARSLATWPGAAEGKPEPSAKSAVRKVAKNYLSEAELRKLNRLVGRLCLRAEDIADDGLHLSLVEWRHLVEVELRMLNRQIAA